MYNWQEVHNNVCLYMYQVTYDVSGFLDKNKDLLFKGLSQAMFACERGLLKELFPEGTNS